MLIETMARLRDLKLDEETSTELRTTQYGRVTILIERERVHMFYRCQNSHNEILTNVIINVLTLLTCTQPVEHISI